MLIISLKTSQESVVIKAMGRNIMEMIKEITAAQQRFVVFIEMSRCFFEQTLQFSRIHDIARIVNKLTTTISTNSISTIT